MAKPQYCERIGCTSCKFGFDGLCKREFGKLKLRKGPFSCNRFVRQGFCADYQPAGWRVSLKESWQGFDDWYEKYKLYWLDGRAEIKGTMSFVLDGNNDEWYEVDMLDFVYGTLFDESGKFKAVRKVWYKRTKKGFGYTLVHEAIDGLENYK